MAYLLDTHTLLWAAQHPVRLGTDAARILRNPNEDVFASAVSAYEVANKHRLGKLTGYEAVAENYPLVIQTLGVTELPLTGAHMYYAARLDWGHRDPFDRMLAAQAILDGLTLITDDRAFASLSSVVTRW